MTRRGRLGLDMAVMLSSRDASNPRHSRRPPPRPCVNQHFRLFTARSFRPTRFGSQAWSGGYLPVDSTEFERLLEAVQTAATGAPAQIGRDRKRSIHGPNWSATTCWSAQARCDWLAARTRPSSLALDPCNLALSGARWSEEGGKPAVLGTGPDGRVRTLVEGTQLECDWSLRGERTSSGRRRLCRSNCPTARWRDLRWTLRRHST